MNNMQSKKNDTIKRKKDHVDICLYDDVDFKYKTNGFERYEFEHYAITELTIGEIDLSTKFFEYKISLPFMISCMTGGFDDAFDINSELASVANKLNIPIGVGSQRQTLENRKYRNSFKILRKNAPNVPVMGNIGAAQIVQMKDPISVVQMLIDLIEADGIIIHINPLQELLQTNGEPNFKGLLKTFEKLARSLEVPIIAKEVGAGISKKAARKLLNSGVKGIDISGAGGTSWSAVELIRSKQVDDFFWDWGIPTAKCLEDVTTLFGKYDFILIASGGIKSGEDIAKALAIGADITASARPILITLKQEGIEGVIKQIEGWFDRVKKIMYLTGSKNLKSFNNSKIFKM